MNLKAENEIEKRVLEYVLANASPDLMRRIDEEGKTIQKCWAYVTSFAKKHAKGNQYCMTDEEAFGLVMHYFEDEPEGATYKSEEDKQREAKRKEEAELREAKRKAEEDEARRKEEERLASLSPEEREAELKAKAEAREKAEADRKAKEVERIATEKARREREEARRKAAEAKKHYEKMQLSLFDGI